MEQLRMKEEDYWRERMCTDCNALARGFLIDKIYGIHPGTETGFEFAKSFFIS